MKDTVVSCNDIQVFCSAKEYKQQLLALIQQARARIFITSLYIQDDEAGREILHALYAAKANFPALDINVFVDFHRGQRGLIGEKESLGNRALYIDLAEHYQQKINIYGVAVKRKELFGVLHLKGMVFDDTIFYTGASINDIYLNQHDRYRLDRYYQINSMPLANSFCQYLQVTFVDSGLAPLFNQRLMPDERQQKRNILSLKSSLKKSLYRINELNDTEIISDKITIRPLVGFGRRDNHLNRAIRQLVQNSTKSILIFTPYFNLPPALARDVIRALKRGVKITLVVGDKTANDFFIADENAFSTIGIVPYIYEMLLKRFVKKWQSFLNDGLLNIYLWKHENNSFHLKGLVVDNRYHMLTGSNLNPRAWSLDLENGLLFDDPSEQLMTQVNHEIDIILANTMKVLHHSDLEDINDYPDKPKKLLKKIRMTQIDKLLKRFL